jgi:two-component system cell cycle sensor histidine kinase/response regulator CckA
MTTDLSSGARWSDGDRRFRTLFDAAAIGIAVVEMVDGRLLETNAALHNMLGYDADELRGKTFSELTYPLDLDADLALFGELTAGARDSYTLEKRYIRKNGTLFWAKLHASVDRDDDGTPRFGIGMVEDISERKALEEQFLQAQKMEAVGRLAGGVAHDFNNVLTVIRGYTEFIIGQSGVSDTRRGDAEEIRHAAERAALLTQQLLAFSRRQARHPQLLDVNRAVREMERLLARLIGEDVTLLLRVAKEPCAILVDPSQLQQILMNLAINARDAMPRGGTLLIETAEEVVTHGTGARACGWSGKHIRISVTDTGEGIPPEHQAQVFEPFFTTKDPSKGTGLGLSTVYGIVKQSGGFIRLRSELGRGTTFDVFLPCAAASAPAEIVIERPRQQIGNETVLLVEDDAGVRRLAERALRANGYRVLTASSGRHALELSTTFPDRIHAIVTDVVMPGMSGPTLVARVETTRPDIRVLYMSGYADDTMAQHGVLEAGTSFLRKPFTPDELARTVREVLD